METNKRRVGRPKASEQTGPLVLSERRARAKLEIEIPADLAEDFAKYVRWVEVSEGMSTSDAGAATVEFALRNVFKRDRLWQEWQRKDERGDGDEASTPTPSRAAQSAAPSPSLPPPSGGRAPGNGTPPASR